MNQFPCLIRTTTLGVDGAAMPATRRIGGTPGALTRKSRG
jgi:hypothetical protein